MYSTLVLGGEPRMHCVDFVIMMLEELDVMMPHNNGGL